MAELEPEDSRNVTGAASTADGRWTNKDGKPPKGVPDKTADKTMADAEKALPQTDTQGRRP